MSYSLAEINRHIQGTVYGDVQFNVKQLKSLEQATKQDISFVNGIKYLEQAKTSQAGVLIVSSDLVPYLKDHYILVEVQSPYLAFAQLTHLFAKSVKISGIATTAKVHPTAKIGQHVTLADYVVVGENASIGDNSVIYPHVYIADDVCIGQNAYIESNVSILSDTVIGDDVRIHANTSIGGEGFGFAPYQGQWHRIAQIGIVRIGNKVRIGSNCSIDRGALDDTIIADGVIIDNLVQVAHNVSIGRHTAIAAACVIAGSTTIGEHCIFGGACAIAGHLTITDHVQLTGMSMVTKSIKQQGTYSSGTSHMENNAWRRAVVGFRQLSDIPLNKLLKQVNNLQNRIEQLELSKHFVKHPDDDEHRNSQ